MPEQMMDDMEDKTEGEPQTPDTVISLKRILS
jgi:hypothetical protein